MNWTENDVRMILACLLEDQLLACQAVLRTTRLEFSTAVPTAAVTLGERSVLLVNLGFLRRHARTEADVRWILLHEFAHVLFRHTRRQVVTRTDNVAFDLIVNAFLERHLPAAEKGFPHRYYARAPWPFCLLRPIYQAEFDTLSTDPAKGPLLQLILRLQHGLRVGGAGASFEELREALSAWPGHVGGTRRWLIGDHHSVPGPVSVGADDLTEAQRRGLAEVARRLHDDALPGGRDPGQGGNLATLEAAAKDHAQNQSWSATRRFLYRLASRPGHRGGRQPQSQERPLPILHPRDRRAVLGSLWTPLPPNSQWSLVAPARGARTRVYVDVSGSFNSEINAVMSTLLSFRDLVESPVQAFSTKLAPVEFARAGWRARSTGGTHVGVVADHLRQHPVARALIITDGWVEQVAEDDRRTFARNGVEFLVDRPDGLEILTRQGLRAHLLPTPPMP